MHSGVAVLKLKSNERELAKKKCSFWTTFFYRSMNLVHLHIFLPRLQYGYEASHEVDIPMYTMCTRFHS